MNEEPVQSLSSTHFGLFDLNNNELEDNNCTYLRNDITPSTVAQSHTKPVKDLNYEDDFLFDYLSKSDDTSVDQAATTTSSLNSNTNSGSNNNVKSLSPIQNFDSDNEDLFHLDGDLSNLNGLEEEIGSGVTAQPGSMNVENKEPTLNDLTEMKNITTQYLNRLKHTQDSHEKFLPSAASKANIQLKPNIITVNKLNKSDYFTITISHEAPLITPNPASNTTLLLPEKNNFMIESASENIFLFLKLMQSEAVGKPMNSLMKSSDQYKLSNLYNSFYRLNNNMNIANSDIKHLQSFKPKPFVCQILVNSSMNNHVKSTDSNPLNDQKSYETMVFIPIDIISGTSKNSLRITFAVKNFKNSINTFKKEQISALSSQSTISNALSSNMFKNSNNDFNIDQFKTKMTDKGLIKSAETEHLKSSFCNSVKPANNVGKLGLIMDIRLGKSVNIFDYVHSNDQNHIIQHIQNVVNKSENTSAIYRLKINEKYAFLQTQSKIVSRKFDPDILHNNDEPVISSIHSIIKEIDTDVEMKGNASTSLMKTLISKKPSISLPNSQKNPANLNHILKSLAIEESTTPSSSTHLPASQTAKTNETRAVSHTDNKSPVSPIGTKFALTMLGITSDTQRIECFLNKEENDTGCKNIVSSDKIPLPSSSLVAEADSITDTKEAGSDVNKHGDEKVSARKNNFLLKKLLLEGGNSINADDPSLDQNEIETYLSDKHENFSTSQPMASSPICSPTFDSSPKPKLSLTSDTSFSKDGLSNTTNKKKCDIILRTLLNTSDIEPHLLKFESVFTVNGQTDSTKTDLFCETQNQQSVSKSTNSTRNVAEVKRTNKKTADSQTPILQVQTNAEPRKRKKVVKSVKDTSESANKPEKSMTKKLNRSNKRNSRATFEDIVFSTLPAKNNTKENSIDRDMQFNLNTYMRQAPIPQNNSTGTNQPTNGQVKLEKMNYPNYLNKENDSIELLQIQGGDETYLGPSQQNYECQFVEQLFVPATTNSNKKIKINKNPQIQSSGVLNQQQSQGPIQAGKEGHSFPSSLASSTISVSSSSSLSSPSTNTLNGINSLNCADSSLSQAQDTLNNNTSHIFLNLTNELLDDFHLTQSLSGPVSSQNQFNKQNGFLSTQPETNEYILSEFDSIADFDAKTAALSIIVDQSSSPYVKQISNVSRNNENRKTDGNSIKSNTNTPKDQLKDEDIAKKERIAAISKHLMSDLEWFKCSQSSPSASGNQSSLFFENSSLGNSRSLLTPTNQMHYYHNESLEQDLNSSFASTSCLSPISNVSNKPHKLGKFEESFTPNLTIEPTNYPQDTSPRHKPVSKPNSTPDFSCKAPDYQIQPNHMNFNHNLQTSNEAFNNTYNMSSPVSNSSQNNTNQTNFKSNDPAQLILRKKLQERIQRNNTTHPYQIPTNAYLASPNSQLYYNRQDLQSPVTQVQHYTPPNGIPPSQAYSMQYNSSPGSNFNSQGFSQPMNSIPAEFPSQDLNSPSQSNPMSTDNNNNNLLSVNQNNSYNFTTQSSVNMTNTNNNQLVQNGNNYLMPDNGDNDFVKKQLGNAVNKRIYHTQNQGSYQYNAVGPEAGMPNQDINNLQQHQQYTPNNHYAVNNQYVHPQYQNQHVSPYYSQNSSSGVNGSMRLGSTGQTINPSYANQYHHIPAHQYQQQTSLQNEVYSQSQRQTMDKSQSFPNTENLPGYQNQQYNNYNYQQNFSQTPKQNNQAQHS